MNIEEKRKGIERLVKIGLVLIVGFAIAPFIFVAIKGLLGLLAAAIISMIIINFTPFLAAKFANWRLKALKFEASQNPIETLENQYRQREEALVRYKENIKTFFAEVQNFYSELEQHKERWPNDTEKFETQYMKMKQLLDLRVTKCKQAQQQLADFSCHIERKRSEWKIAQAAKSMSKSAQVGEDFISKLMTDTALDAVQTDLNIAFSDLELSLLEEGAPQPQLQQQQPRQIVLESSKVLAEKPTLDLDFGSIAVRES